DLVGDALVAATVRQRARQADEQRAILRQHLLAPGEPDEQLPRRVHLLFVLAETTPGLRAVEHPTVVRALEVLLEGERPRPVEALRPELGRVEPRQDRPPIHAEPRELDGLE